MEISVGFRGRVATSAALAVALADEPLVLRRLRSWASVLRHIVQIGEWIEELVDLTSCNGAERTSNLQWRKSKDMVHGGAAKVNIGLGPIC